MIYKDQEIFYSAQNYDKADKLIKQLDYHNIKSDGREWKVYERG